VRPVSADVCQQKEKDFRATIRGNTGGAAAAQKIQTEEEIRRGHPLVWMVGVWNWSPFYTQTDQFTKRGSGQTSKKRNKMGCVLFSAGMVGVYWNCTAGSCCGQPLPRH
jgi:hypothetical protein